MLDIQVGACVRFTMACQAYVATVIEDRGNIGVAGRRILRVEVTDPEGWSFEIPADRVDAVVPI